MKIVLQDHFSTLRLKYILISPCDRGYSKNMKNELLNIQLQSLLKLHAMYVIQHDAYLAAIKYSCDHQTI